MRIKRVLASFILGLALTLAILGLLTGGSMRLRTLAYSDSFVVTNTNASGAGSLWQAVLDANARPGSDAISFGPGATGTIVLTDALPAITGTLTITGPGAGQLAISGNGTHRVFSVTSGAAVTITGVTVRDGYVKSEHGGGICNAGILRLYNVRVISNAVDGTYGGGGGVCVCGSGAALSVNGGELNNNSASWNGGGLYVRYGSVTLTGTQIISNSAIRGGGLYVYEGRATLTGTHLVSNSADKGGGLFVASGGAVLTETRILSNSATSTGGGLYLDSHSGVITAASSCVVYNTNTAVCTREDVTRTLNARGNWWGASDGPSGEGPGSGDSIGANVDYADYKTAPPAGCPTVRLPDLIITKAVTPPVTVPGETITYTVSISNMSNITASSVVVTDAVPVSVTETAVVSSGVTITQHVGTRYVWDVADLAPGEGGLITITGVLSDSLSAGVFTNTATISTTLMEADLSNNCDNASITVTGEVPPNTPPTISEIPDQSTRVNTPISVTFTISDAETVLSSLALSADSNDAALVPVENIDFYGREADRTTTITPATKMTGMTFITITVSDGELSAKESFALTVSASVPPEFTSTPVEIAIMDSLYLYHVSATDPGESDALTITAPIIPDWLTLTELGDGTATLEGTPTAEGSYDVVLEVTNGEASNTQAFTIRAQEGREPGEWNQLDLRGGRANALELSPDFPADGIAFGGGSYYIRQTKTGSGLFKSIDGGRSWTLSTTTIETDTQITGVDDIAFSPDFGTDQTVFAATSSGLFTSTDAGATWSHVEELGRYLLYGMRAVAVAPDYSSSGHVMASDGNSLHISENRGISWTTHSELDSVNSLAYSPDFARDQTVFVGGGAIWRTSNGGITWTTALSQGISALAISPEFTADNTLIAGSLNGTVYLSSNAGATWISRTVSPMASTVNALAVSSTYISRSLHISGTAVFAGCVGGLYRSTDGGRSWAPMTSYPGPSVQALMLSPDWPEDPTMLVGTPAGVYRTEDGGATWSRSGFKQLSLSVLEGTQRGERLLAGSSYQGLFQSEDVRNDDGGTQWEPAGLYEKTFIDVAEVPDYPSDPTLFASVGAGAGLSLYRSDDGGNEWTHLRSADHPGGHWALSPTYAQDGTVFVTGGSSNAVLRSTDRGETWERVGEWPTGTYGAARFVLLSPNYPTDTTLWAAGGGFWRRAHGTTTWSSMTLPAPNIEISDIAISPNFRQDGTFLAAGSNREDGSYVRHYAIFRSEDAGETWTRATLAFSDTTPLKAVAFSPRFEKDRTAYASSEKQLFRSLDGGKNWVAVGAPPDGELRDIVAQGYGHVSIATETGIWQYTTEWEDMVVNGGFEADSGWEFPITPLPAAPTTIITHTGKRAVRIGVGEGSPTPDSTAYSAVRQEFTIPGDALEVTLHFYYYPHSEATAAEAADLTAVAATSTPLAGDLQYAIVMEEGKAHYLFQELVDEERWTPRTFDLSEYAGRSIALHFGVANDGKDGHTGMYLDDVILLVRRPRPSALTEHIYLPLVMRNFQSGCKG